MNNSNELAQADVQTESAGPMAPSPEPQREMTIGEYRVGISFNPGGNSKVDAIKHAAANLIDLLDTIVPVSQEVAELTNLAMRRVEEAAMWGVKAVTK